MTAEDKCLKLLTETNKPYNVQGVADMLASQGVKKTQADKALEALAEQGKIVRKEFGKTKIYYPSQEGLAELSTEEKDAKLAEIKTLSDKLKQYDESITSLKKELAASSATLSVDQLRTKFEELQQTSEALNKKLAGHRAGVGPKISTSDVTAAETRLRTLLDAWDRRRRVFNGLWSDMSENIEGKQKDIFEDIGVETDEGVGEAAGTYRKLLASGPKKARV